MILHRSVGLPAISAAAALCVAFGGVNVAVAQDQGSMADLYEPEYVPLETRLGTPWNKAGLPNVAVQNVENLHELPEGTQFLLETDTFATAVADGILTSQVSSKTGAVTHAVGRGGSISYKADEEVPREYVNRVAVSVVYPDGSRETVQPQSVIKLADDIYYHPDPQYNRMVKPGETLTIPLTMTNGQAIPEGSKVVADRYGSIESAEVRGVAIDIDEETGEITVTFPEERTGGMWFRTELIYADGTYEEIHYSFEVTDAPARGKVGLPFGSSLSSR